MSKVMPEIFEAQSEGRIAIRIKQGLAWALAVVLAAAAVGLLNGLVTVVSPLAGGGFFALAVLTGFAVALPLATVVGVPVALLYLWRGWDNVAAVLIGGLLLGMLPYYLWIQIGLWPHFEVDWGDLEIFALLGLYGATAALVFWFTLRTLDRLRSAKTR